jgi:disulfide oxidoreductase YuzD
MVVDPLKNNYGDAVAISYFDVNDEGLHPDIKRLIEEHNLPVPLTFINGESVSAGYISYYDLTRRIDGLFKTE